MSEALAEQIFLSVEAGNAKPLWQVIDGGRETTPRTSKLEVVPQTHDDCLLADVDDLGRYRAPDGLSYDPTAVKSVRQGLVAAVKEGAMPYAVSEVEQEWEPSAEGKRGGIIRSLGRTAVQTAIRGHIFYQTPEGHARGDVEVARASYLEENLKSGRACVMLSAKMTRADAPLAVAKAEGLAETDSIQVDWLGLGENGDMVAKTASILVEGVPLQAYVDMLADSNNMFGKSVPVPNPESALSLMQTFAELELPLEALKEGPITILAAVIPYIHDPEAKQKVLGHLEKLRGDQTEMHERAQSPADRWLKFDMATDQSLYHGVATEELHAFIESLEDNWGDEDREIIARHKIIHNGKEAFRMTRPLAKVLQKAVQNLILTSAAVVTHNEKVLKQLSPAVARRIYEDEIALSQTYAAGIQIGYIATANNSLIASHNVKVGGCCVPAVKTNFLSIAVDSIAGLLKIEQPETAEAEKIKELSWHGGSVKEDVCKNCKDHTHVGVENWCKPCIQNPNRSKKVVSIQRPKKSNATTHKGLIGQAA